MIGHFVSVGAPEFTEPFLLDPSFLPQLSVLLHSELTYVWMFSDRVCSCDSSAVRKEVAWVLSNICALSAAAVDAVVHAGLVPQITSLFVSTSTYSDLKNEVCSTFILVCLTRIAGVHFGEYQPRRSVYLLCCYDGGCHDGLLPDRAPGD